MFLYVGAQLIRYAVRSVSTKRVNEEVQTLYEQAMATPLPVAAVIDPAEIEREASGESRSGAAAAPEQETIGGSRSDELAAPEQTEANNSPSPAPELTLLSAYQYIGDTILPECAELIAKNRI